MNRIYHVYLDRSLVVFLLPRLIFLLGIKNLLHDAFIFWRFLILLPIVYRYNPIFKFLLILHFRSRQLVLGRVVEFSLNHILLVPGCWSHFLTQVRFISSLHFLLVMFFNSSTLIDFSTLDYYVFLWRTVYRVQLSFTGIFRSFTITMVLVTRFTLFLPLRLFICRFLALFLLNFLQNLLNCSPNYCNNGSFIWLLLQERE